MFGCYGVSFVEWVKEGGVEGSKGEFVDYVGEVECCDRKPTISDCAITNKTKKISKQDDTEERTIMIQMLPRLHIPMSPRRNMEIPLHLITF